MPPTRSSRPSRSSSSKGGPEWLGTSSGRVPRRSSSRRLSTTLEQFDAAASLEQQPGTPQLRDSPAGGVSPRVRFRDDPLFVASGDAHPAHVSHALRGRAEGLRIQAELLEKEAHQHETRHKIASGQSCGQEAGSDIHAAWDKSVKAIEQLCGAAVALCLSAGSCGSAPPPRPRASTPRVSALRPPGLAPIRSYERPLPLADPGPAPVAVPSGALPPSRQASILRRTSSGRAEGLPPTRQLTRSGSAPERRSRSVPAEEAVKAAPPGLWRRALRNLSNARAAKPDEPRPRKAGDVATGSGSPRSQARFQFS